ncbi:MAG TPA: F0F1 ATP synthase subunit B [Phycisphaerae bacterium]|nr:F0F1 ATP synthase subunit B [Phycisphaerae bacterium]
MSESRWHSKVAATTGILAVANPVWAAGAENGGQPSLFGGDLGNAIWTLVIFLLLLFVLGRFAWGPLLRALQKREEFIRDSLAKAKKEREQAEARLRQIEERLASARDEAGVIVDEGRRGAETIKQAAHKAARTETDAMIERARREIGLARDTAVKELYDLTAMLATEAASRVIGKELDPREHERLISEAIAELSEGNGQGKPG